VAVVCTDCGKSFYVAPEHSWKSVCRFCYKHELRASDEVARLAAENARLRRDLEAARLGKRMPLGFDRARWRQLVQLAHPDRHKGSAAATDATRWLLTVRPE
jgi:hypothetical protein